MKLAVLVLLLSLALSTYVYKNSNDGLSYDVKGCERLKGVPRGTPKQIECMNNEGILEPWPKYIQGSITSHIRRTDEVLCRGQRGLCLAKREYMTDLSAGCKKMVDGCRSALRHLQEMMFTSDSTKQECNNFALKSVRGFFHDYMTTDIEGSVLSENHLDMNVGLCRWTQYINVLSDHTKCDAGSIIQMAGFLGYEACGFQLWDVDIDVKPYVSLNRGMMCESRSKINVAPKKQSHPLFDSSTGQRLEEFADITISANSTAQENFWCSVNPHSCATGQHKRNDGLSDGEAEYSVEATAAAHVIGRVTCPVEGKNLAQEHPTVTPGFFHLPRTDRTKAKGMEALRERVSEGYSHLRETQCDRSADWNNIPSSDGNVPTGAIRPSTEKWPRLTGETNLNTIGGACGMPTQFLQTVRAGNKHRVPRFMAIAADSSYRTQTEAQKKQCTDSNRKMYIPLELLTLRDDMQLPTSPALGRFLNIAWDGVGTINSEWDSCVVGCDINVKANSLCGGDGLSDFVWETAEPKPPTAPTTEPEKISSFECVVPNLLCWVLLSVGLFTYTH